jgi:hypothetical protein
VILTDGGWPHYYMHPIVESLPVRKGPLRHLPA